MKLIVDCDPGNGIPGANVDDAVALTFALRHPAFDVRAIWTVFGNVSATEGYDAARRLLSGSSEIPPIRCGSDRPLSGRRGWWRDRLDAPSEDPAVYSPWGVRDPPQPDRARELAADPLPALVDDLIRAGDGVVLACLGPLTNIARIVLEAPHAMAGVRAAHLMGGCLGLGELVDTNFAVDPRAAEVVLNSGIPLTITPLDVTRTTELSRADWQAVRSRASGRPDLGEIGSWLEPWLEYSSRTRPVSGMWLHDLAVVAALAEPALVSRENVRLRMARQPAGKLVRDPEGAPAVLVTGIDNRRLVDLWAETLLSSA